MLNYFLVLFIFITGCAKEPSPVISHGNIINGAGAPEKFVYLSLGGRGICSGSLIAPSFILTAAHCLIGLGPHEIDITIGTDAVAYSKSSYQIQKLHIHPQFNGPENDIALIELTSPVRRISPVALYGRTFKEKKIYTIEAYGFSTFTSSLAKDFLSFFREEDPLNMPNNLDGNGVTRLYGKLLPAVLLPERGNDIHLLQYHGGICVGDSGGPILLRSTQGKVLVGVSKAVATTNEFANCNALAIATPVAPHIIWIKRITRNTIQTVLENEKVITEDSCALLQGRVALRLMEEEQSIKSYRCNKELIQSMAAELETARKTCFEDLAKSYPEVLNETILKLQQDC